MGPHEGFMLARGRGQVHEDQTGLGAVAAQGEALRRAQGTVLREVSLEVEAADVRAPPLLFVARGHGHRLEGAPGVEPALPKPFGLVPGAGEVADGLFG